MLTIVCPMRLRERTRRRKTTSCPDAGMPVSRQKLTAVIEEATQRRKAHEAQLKQQLGPWINFDSPDQLRDHPLQSGQDGRHTLGLGQARPR